MNDFHTVRMDNRSEPPKPPETILERASAISNSLGVVEKFVARIKENLVGVVTDPSDLNHDAGLDGSLASIERRLMALCDSLEVLDSRVGVSPEPKGQGLDRIDRVR